MDCRDPKIGHCRELVTYDSGGKEIFECSIDSHNYYTMHLGYLRRYIAAAINKTRCQQKIKTNSS